MLLFLLLIAMVGCSDEEVDYDSVYDEYYSEIEYDGSDLDYDICANQTDGTSLHIEIDYVFRYDNLDEMIEDDYSKFVYGEVYSIEDYNCISDSVYLIVYDSEFTNDSRKLIRVSITEDIIMSVGGKYILNLNYNEDNDVYFLSQQSDSILRVNSSNLLTGTFLTDEYPDNPEEFVVSIFE
jgi:hypothetical protein